MVGHLDDGGFDRSVVPITPPLMMRTRASKTVAAADLLSTLTMMPSITAAPGIVKPKFVARRYCVGIPPAAASAYISSLTSAFAGFDHMAVPNIDIPSLTTAPGGRGPCVCAVAACAASQTDRTTKVVRNDRFIGPPSLDGERHFPPPLYAPRRASTATEKSGTEVEIEAGASPIVCANASARGPRSVHPAVGHGSGAGGAPSAARFGACLGPSRGALGGWHFALQPDAEIAHVALDLAGQVGRALAQLGRRGLHALRRRLRALADVGAQLLGGLLDVLNQPGESLLWSGHGSSSASGLRSCEHVTTYEARRSSQSAGYHLQPPPLARARIADGMRRMAGRR